MKNYKAERVRLALLEYIILYDEPSLRVMSKKMNTNYNNLTSFLNQKKVLGEPSLKKIIRYIESAANKQIQLEGIINKIN